MTQPVSERRVILSSRHREILALIAAGHTNPSIAAELQVSLNTVKSHLDIIFGRLEVHDRAHAVAEAFRAGVLT